MPRMKKPHAPKVTSTPAKSKSARGKGNPAQQPRIHQVFAIMKRNDLDPNPDKRYPTLRQIALMIQGNDPEPLSNDTITRILDMMRDDWGLPVDFIPKRKGHGFTEPVAGFPLDVIKEEDLPGQAEAKGKYLMDKLMEINSPNIREVRGIGLMVGIEMKQKVTGYIKSLQEKKVIALNAGMTVIRLLPPLVITYEQIDRLVEALTEVLVVEQKDE